MASFKRVKGVLLQLVAAVLIILAVLVGAARLALLEAPRFADDVRRIALDATGFNLDFSALSAGFSVYGPELQLSDVQLGWPDGTPVAAAGQVTVAIALADLLTGRAVRPSRIYVEDSAIAVRVTEAGQILIQGALLQDYLPADAMNQDLADVRVVLEDIALSFADDRRGIAPAAAEIRRLDAAIADGVAEVRLDLIPEEALGRRLEVEGIVPLALLPDPQRYTGQDVWRLRARAQDFRLDPWLRLMNLAEAPIIDTDGTAEAAVDFRGLQPQRVTAELDVGQLELTQPDAPPIGYDRLAGKLAWERADEGWVATGNDFVIVRDGRAWPADSFVLRYRDGEGDDFELDVQVGFMRLEDLLPVARAFAAEQLAEGGVAGELQGDVSALAGELTVSDGELADFELAGEFVGLGYSDPARNLRLTGLSGSLATTRQSGQLNLQVQNADVYLGTLFREPWVVNRLKGLAVWRENADGYRLIANDLQIATPEGQASASLELQTDLAFTDPVMDLTAVAAMTDTNQVVKYLPQVVPDKVVTWLREALQGGRAPQADFRLQGPLRKFPFRNDEGEFRVVVDFADGGLDYAPGWPGVRAASGRLIFANESLFSTENEFLLGKQQVRDAELMIADLKEGRVRLNGSGAVDLGNLVEFLQRSPLAERLGPVFAEVRASGAADARAELTLPLRDLGSWQLTGELNLRQGSAWLTTLEPRFSAVSGTLRIRDTFLSADRLNAKLLGEPVVISLEPDAQPQADWSHRAVVAGSMPYDKIEQALSLPQLGKISGRAAFEGVALFPALRPDATPFRLRLNTDLVGIESRIPYPLGKPAAQAETLRAELLFPERERIDVALELSRGLLAQLRFEGREQKWQLRSGAVGLNAPPPAFVGADGLIVVGVTDRLDVGAWTTAFAEPDTASEPSATGLPRSPAAPQGRQRWQDYFDRVDLDIGALYVLGYRFADVEVGAGFGADAWDISLAGPQLSGRMSVPYEFAATERIDFAMQRLALVDSITADEVDSEENPYSPLDMPAIRGTAEDFVLGNLNLGRLDADITRTARGLESQRLTTRAPSFDLQVAGDWLVIDNAQRSRLRVEMNSTDMEQTLTSLGYSPLVDAEDGRLVADLLWEGGPGNALLYASTGTVDFAITDGEVKEIDPGTGRILGLLSVTSLPRRLALDFSDMTDDGLVFDTLKGSFRLDFGDAWTCNLSLEGEVADMAIVGRTGIRREDYDQVAVVRPHVSNLIPVSAAFLGGPTVGIATLLVAQIFKKPLSGIGESYYTVRGSWSSPDIQKTQRSELDTSAFGDCESQLPQLSQEEIAAIEDLINSAREPAQAPETSTNIAESP
ncbi:MAG: YhdP family protein [Gammaproteobacteria bacterium]|jgi:uncharacterized protein (TIGR02099 family)|nr:YhdP family protein [Gammaproteobacteria bacterium]